MGAARADLAVCGGPDPRSCGRPARRHAVGGMSAPTSLRTSAGKLGRFLHRFGPLVRAQRRLLVGAALLIVADVGLKLLEPWPLGLVLDEVVAKKPSGRLPGWLAGATDGELLAGCVAAVVLIALVRALAAYLSTVFLALAGNRVLTAVRSDLYRHVQRLSLRFHARARTGDLITRLTGDVGRLQEVAVTAALPLVINTATLLSMCVLMLVMNVQLALVAMASLPLISPTFVRRSGDIRRVARRQRAREGAMATVAAESLAAMKLVQALGLERTLERAFASQNTASLKEGVKAKKLAAGLERKVDVLTAIGTAMVLLFGARQVRSGSLSPGELVVFMLYLKTAFKPMQDLAKYAGRIAQASASAERILELLDTRPEITDAPDAVAAPRLRGALGLEHVTFGYEPGRPVLRNVSLHVPEGRMIALVGPSGAGKASVLG